MISFLVPAFLTVPKPCHWLEVYEQICFLMMMYCFCWFAYATDVMMLLMRWYCWCTDPADALILLMRWCYWIKIRTSSWTVLKQFAPVGDMELWCTTARLWRVPATLPYPDLIFTTRTLPGKLLKISRVQGSNYTCCFHKGLYQWCQLFSSGGKEFSFIIPLYTGFSASDNLSETQFMNKHNYKL